MSVAHRQLHVLEWTSHSHVTWDAAARRSNASSRLVHCRRVMEPLACMMACRSLVNRRAGRNGIPRKSGVSNVAISSAGIGESAQLLAPGVHADVSWSSQRAKTSSSSSTLNAAKRLCQSRCADSPSFDPRQIMRRIKLPAGQELLLSRADPEKSAAPGTMGVTCRKRLDDWLGSFGLSRIP